MHPVALQHEEGLIVSFETTKTTSEAVVEAFLNMNSVMTQTDLDTSPENNVSFMYCWQDPSTNEASTQTCINVNKPENRPKKVIVVAPQPAQTETVGVGPDCDMRPGFIGFDDIKTDSDMKQLAGVSLSMFQILLAFIKPLTHGQPKYYKVMNVQNRLLLFLMKMKLGLTFGAIGVFFHISASSVSSIFYSVLETLHENTKTWVFWPSREAIRSSMPSVFKNYPNCRAIIDCTEIRTDTPPSLDKRALMYSSYKSGFTVKYLIGISPSGKITFLSKGYGGRSTDGFIVVDSGFINLVEPGDEIMADKGFPTIKNLDNKNFSSVNVF
ncbi:fatty-acid amide hydrolase 2-like protein [Lasius niger]|uniref:Fatty-acid amide hydrolase 2-like protein n=1 Tax=Lasius niger TaxID=67767 RepID=A0A0J7K5K1_LASNI|nr:fatty-acid amide hydrolase 2-like protein [Lasius niger]